MKCKYLIGILEGKGIVELPTGRPFPDDTFNFAVFHQLHCLVRALLFLRLVYPLIDFS